MEPTKTIPRYNALQNCAFMVQRAWRNCKSVLVIAVGLIACGVGASLLELFVVPAILEAVEQGVSINGLVRCILAFTLSLAAVSAGRIYLSENALFGRIKVRLGLYQDVHLAVCRTAYPHMEDPNYIGRLEKIKRSLWSNQAATEAIWETLTGLLTNLICFAVYLLVLTAVGPGVILLSTVLAALGYFAGKRARAYAHLHRDEEGYYWNKLNYVIQRSQDTTLGKDIRIFGLGPWLMELYRKYTRLDRDFWRKAHRSILRAEALDVLLAFLRNAAAYGWLIVLALRGELTAAEFVLYFNAVSGFTEWVTGLFSAISTLHQQSLDLSTLREFLETPEPFRFEDGRPLAVRPDHLYTLELRDVSFRYPGADRDTLSHVNLTIHPGEKLAVVGRNGAGKTTLIKLLCGLCDPTEGQVLLDGEDIRQFNRRDYYRHFSAVFQQFSLLPGTIAENVAQREDLDRPRVWECLERAGLADKIRDLPQQEETHLGRDVYLDGVDLSGGQIQCLMLARALYKDAPLMFLDEPTAALDPLAESDLYHRYNELTQHCTSVYISHRLASTRFCDRILLIADGGIAEEGTHEALLKQGGEYARLFDIQRQYYQEGAIGHD